MRKALALLVIVAPFSVSAETLRGIAKNQKGEVVYFEKHEVKKDESGLNKQIRVEYTKPDGSLFATMTSDFSSHRTVPVTHFEDKRFGSKTTIRVAGTAVEFEKFKGEKSILKKTFPLNEAMVASQGFDNFIKLKSDKLASAAVDFKFGVLENQDFYSLTGYRKSPASSEELEFGIRASSWLVRLFAHELKVVYDAKTMRLKSFSGRSNILDDSGKTQDVDIEYSWSANP